MSYLRYLCLCGYSGVQHILCNVFVRLMCHMLSVSRDCPFVDCPFCFLYYLLRPFLFKYKNKKRQPDNQYTI